MAPLIVGKKPRQLVKCFLTEATVDSRQVIALVGQVLLEDD